MTMKYPAADFGLHSFYTIRCHELNWYLYKYCKPYPKQFKLSTLLNILMTNCKKTNMIDSHNPSMICCDRDFSYALGCKVLHRSQLPYFILQQLLVLPNPIEPNVVIQFKTLTPTTNKPYFKNKKFYLTTSFRAVISCVPSFLKHVYVYTYSEAYVLLFEYLNVKKLYGVGNPYCYLIVDDPLSNIFNVKAFHYNQIPLLLKTKLIPVKS